MSRLRVLVAVFAAMLTIVAVPARAQGAGSRKKRAAPRKILKLEELKVEGRIQKPQAMFLMPRANLSYDELDRFDPLLPKVTRAVERDPF
jgi:hypothetical protein